MIEMNLDEFASNLKSTIFSQNCSHVPVRLRRLDNYRILWLSSVGKNIDINNYSELACEIDEDLNLEPFYIGMADRYGGVGIGHNGGSGRNVIIDKFSVKGIGRTPLVSPSSAKSHTSGWAYLEECVREAIFSEVVGHDFPFGAIRVLCIIDTLKNHQWPVDIQPNIERRTLLARENFCRPAHFERATGFEAGNLFEGEKDTQRVAAVFSNALKFVSPLEFSQLIDDFWLRWAHQLAYGFVNRVSHGNNTPSNISLDGSLLDFGAASSVPFWGDIATSNQFESFENLLDCVEFNIRSMDYFINRYVKSKSHDESYVIQKINRLRIAFKIFVGYEALRLFGVDDIIAAEFSLLAEAEEFHRLIKVLMRGKEGVRLDMTVAHQITDEYWLAPKIWSKCSSGEFLKLQSIVKSLIKSDQLESSMIKCKIKMESRPCLYSKNMREHFFKSLLDKNEGDFSASSVFISNHINSVVAANLRDEPVVGNRRNSIIMIHSKIKQTLF